MLRAVRMMPRLSTLFFVLVSVLVLLPRSADAAPDPAAPPTPPASSTNTARARVVVANDPAATSAFAPDADVVRKMVENGLLGLTGKPTANDAWKSLVATGDVVGFKVTAAPGAVSGTRPAVVRPLIEGLIASGHAPSKIVIWDKRDLDLRAAGWSRLAQELGVRCVASEDAGWDGDRSYESPLIGRLVAGDRDFGKKENEGTGRRSYVTKLLTHDITKMVSVAPVLSHNVSGVNGHIAGLAWASTDNTLRFANDPVRLAEAAPDICALDDVLPKLAFAVGDALLCQYRGEELTLLHYAVALDELRFSKDAVALDVLALADVQRFREAAKVEGEKKFVTELYTNAELIELGVADPKRIDRVRVP